MNTATSRTLTARAQMIKSIALLHIAPAGTLLGHDMCRDFLVGMEDAELLGDMAEHGAFGPDNRDDLGNLLRITGHEMMIGIADARSFLMRDITIVDGEFV